KTGLPIRLAVLKLYTIVAYPTTNSLAYSLYTARSRMGVARVSAALKSRDPGVRTSPPMLHQASLSHHYVTPLLDAM
ncbi:hypothetical protein N7527_005562, partial [Penicillium freii]